MSYIRNPKRGVLATPWGCWNGGDVMNNVSKVPPAVLKTWLANEEVVTNDDGPEVDELPEQDLLSQMSRQQLLQIIKTNELPFRSKPSWSDESVRQAIRDSVQDLNSLKISHE